MLLLDLTGGSNRIDYFANRGSDNSYFVMRDKARGLLVVRYRFIF